MRKNYEAYLVFLTNYRKATKKLGQVDQKMDRCYKRMMFRHWRE